MFGQGNLPGSSALTVCQGRKVQMLPIKTSEGGATSSEIKSKVNLALPLTAVH